MTDRDVGHIAPIETPPADAPDLSAAPDLDVGVPPKRPTFLPVTRRDVGHIAAERGEKWWDLVLVGDRWLTVEGFDHTVGKNGDQGRTGPPNGAEGSSLSPVELFVGRFDRSLDTKGRVILPARLRNVFENSGYLAPHDDGCIALWTDAEFSAEADRQHAREAEGQPARHEVREWFSHVTRVQLDGQGRMAIPPDLRGHAELESDVLFVGVHDRVELWSRQRWESRTPAGAGAGGSGT